MPRTEIDLEIEDWREHGECWDTADPAFFPEEKYGGKDAKVICKVCLVQEICLDYAVQTRQPSGIWGGLGFAARLRIRYRKEE